MDHLLERLTNRTVGRVRKVETASRRHLELSPRPIGHQPIIGNSSHSPCRRRSPTISGTSSASPAPGPLGSRPAYVHCQVVVESSVVPLKTFPLNRRTDPLAPFDAMAPSHNGPGFGVNPSRCQAPPENVHVWCEKLVQFGPPHPP